MQEPQQPRYWGFISYSHRDRKWGEWLHRALESYRVPKRLVGTAGAHGPVPARLFPIFRDRAELSTAAGLSGALAQAIEGSRFFIVVCSPGAASSRWVNEEIRHAKRLGLADRILCLIVDGEPYASDGAHPERECFPPALRHDVGPDGELATRAPEPLAADVRSDGDGRDDARLKLIAGLLGLGFDALRRRDLQARNRRLGLIAAGAVLVSLAMVAMTVRAVVAERAADNSRQRGEDLIGFMLGDLRAKLEPLGKLDILDAVGDQAMSYFEKLDSRNLSEAALVARAKALRQIGDVRFQQGRSADAGTAFDAALVLNRKIAAYHPEDAELQFELGQAEFWVAYARWSAKQYDRAEAHFQAYRRIAQQLVDREPGNPRWQTELAYADSNLGSLEAGRNAYARALEYFRESAERLVAISPLTVGLQDDLANTYSWQGTMLQYLGRPREAVAILRKVVATAREHLTARPNDHVLMSNLASAYSALGFAALAADDRPTARAVVAEGRSLTAALTGNDSSNQDYRMLAGTFELFDASLATLAGRPTVSGEALARAFTYFQALHALDPKRGDAIDRLRPTFELQHAVAMATGNRPQAQSAAAAAAALCAEAAGLSEAGRAETCAVAGLLAHELAGAAGRTEQSATIAAQIDRLAAAGGGAQMSALRARLLLLDGEPEAARALLVPLLAEGYLPPDLHLFLLRHCQPALALPGLDCPTSPRGS